MPTLADLFGSAAAFDQSYPSFAYGATSPPSDLWWLQRATALPWLPNSVSAFAPLPPQANVLPPSTSPSTSNGGGLLGPIFGNGADANSTSANGILSSLFPDPPQNSLRMSSTSSPLVSLTSGSPPLVQTPYSTSSPLLAANWQPTSGAAQDLTRIPDQSDPAGLDQQPIPSGSTLRPWPDPRVVEQLSSPQDPEPTPDSIAAPTTNASDGRASDAAVDGKLPDPDFDTRYAQIIASDPELITAVRMAENAGDNTFRDWLATVLHNLEHNPAAAFEAIRQAAFTNQIRAETHQTGADIIANMAVRKAAERLESLNPGQGVARAHYQGFRAAVDFSEDQRQTLYTIASNPSLSASEKLDRFAKAGLFDVALAGSLAGFGGFASRLAPLGPADRPGGGSGSRVSRNSAPGGGEGVNAPGRPSTAEAVARAIRAEVRRNTPGVVSGNGANVNEQWLADMDAPVPAQVAALLGGRKVRNFAHLRDLFWRAVASVPELAAQFSPQNRGLMSGGRAPRAPRNQQMTNQPEFRLHHPHQLGDGGPVYDLDNIRVVSPRRHDQIHYGHLR